MVKKISSWAVPSEAQLDEPVSTMLVSGTPL
jgi:hypothetical protein